MQHSQTLRVVPLGHTSHALFCCRFTDGLLHLKIKSSFSIIPERSFGIDILETISRENECPERVGRRRPVQPEFDDSGVRRRLDDGVEVAAARVLDKLAVDDLKLGGVGIIAEHCR